MSRRPHIFMARGKWIVKVADDPRVFAFDGFGKACNFAKMVYHWPLSHASGMASACLASAA